MKQRKTERRYFVYALVDPRTGEEFYYGKGTGRRPHAHLADFRAKRIVNRVKHKRIGEIVEAGLGIEIRGLHDALEEHEAFRLESELISEAKATRTLTNGNPGIRFRGVGYSLGGLIRARRRVNNLLGRTRPLREWARYIICDERRKFTADDLEFWHDTVKWLADLRKELDSKISEAEQVLSHHMQPMEND